MAIISERIDRALQIQVDHGETPEGNRILRRFGFSRVKFDASIGDLYAVADAIGSLQKYPVDKIIVRNTDELIEEEI